MKDLVIEKSYSTPLVTFNSKTGMLVIEGRSIPENPTAFYNSLEDWLTEYFKAPQAYTKIDLKLDYINSGSSKSLLSLLKLARNYFEKGAKGEVNWYFDEDDESIRDLGKHFRTILKMSFNLVEIM